MTMHAVLEYLAIGILLIYIIVAASQMIDAPARTVETVKAEQLFTVAERIMDKILMTPGHPENWGADLCNDSEIEDFGLALAGATAPYIVDPDKVMRLANLTPVPNPMPIKAERIAELLGIKGEYGFRLEMKPMITSRVETVYSVDNVASAFKVQVVNWYGIGLPNARVKGLYVVARVKPGAPQEGELSAFDKTCVTDSLGFCILDFSGSVRNLQRGGGEYLAPFLILHIEWEGFVSVSGYSPALREAPVIGYVIGNAIFIERLDDVTGVFQVKNVTLVVPYYSLLIEPIEVEKWCRAKEDPQDLWCHEIAGRVLPAGYDYLIIKVKSMERLSSHIIVTGVWTKGGKDKGVAIVISRIPEIDITYGPINVESANAVTLTRIAQIYNYPYIVRLTLWRLVEGWP